MLVSKAFAGRTHRGVRSSGCNPSFWSKNQRESSSSRIRRTLAHGAVPRKGKARAGGRNRCFARLCRNSIAIEMKIAFRQSDFIGPSQSQARKGLAPSSARLDCDCTSLHPPPGFSLTRFWFALRRPLHRQHSRRRPRRPPLPLLPPLSLYLAGRPSAPFVLRKRKMSLE